MAWVFHAIEFKVLYFVFREIPGKCWCKPPVRCASMTPRRIKRLRVCQRQCEAKKSAIACTYICMRAYVSTCISLICAQERTSPNTYKYTYELYSQKMEQRNLTGSRYMYRTFLIRFLFLEYTYLVVYTWKAALGLIVIILILISMKSRSRTIAPVLVPWIFRIDDELRLSDITVILPICYGRIENSWDYYL